MIYLLLLLTVFTGGSPVSAGGVIDGECPEGYTHFDTECVLTDTIPFPYGLPDPPSGVGLEGLKC